MQTDSFTSNNINSFDVPKSTSRSFVTILLAVTVLPFIAGPLLRSVYSNSAFAQHLFITLLLIGGVHQITSVYLYFDNDAKSIINKHKTYFYLGPIIIAILCASLFMANTQWIEDHFYTAFAMLTIFHYQKQNIGVYSLLAPVIGTGRMIPFERYLIMGGALVGMLVFASPVERTLFQGTFLFPFEKTIENLSLVLLCVLILFTVYFIVKNFLWTKRAQQQYLRAGLLFGLVIFFCPIFIIEDKLTAFFMYATAHGLQYFVFLASASLNGKKIQQILTIDPKKGRYFRTTNFIKYLILSILLAYLWKVLAAANPPSFLIFTEAEMKKGILGLSLSITLAHYWIDSRIWKMRHQDSREFVRSKFHFLF